MKKRITILFLSLHLSGFSQQIEWLHELNNNYYSAYVSGVDQSGNAYVAGNYRFSPPGVFLYKYNSAGTLVNSDISSSISDGGVCTSSITDWDGNTYMVGRVVGDITLGGYTFSNISGSPETFLAKYDSACNVLWARKFEHSTPRNVKVDKQGNIYVCGNCNNTIIDGFNLDGGFVAKFDSSGNCTMAFSDSQYLGISTVDNVGNIFTLCVFSSGDCRVRKYNQGGILQWTTSAGSYGGYLAVDKFGNCYITGFLSGSETFGTTTLYGTGMSGYGTYLCRLDSNGHYDRVLYSLEKAGLGLDIDTNGIVYTMDASRYAVTVGKYDTSGTYHFIDSIPATADYWYDPYVIKTDNMGNAYVSGTTVEENNKGFIAKISENVTSVQSQESNSSFTVFPNPANESVTVCYTGEGGTCNLKVSNLTGQVFYNKKLEPVNGTLNARIDLKAYSKGMYFIEVAGEKRRLVKKVIVN